MRMRPASYPSRKGCCRMGQRRGPTGLKLGLEAVVVAVTLTALLVACGPASPGRVNGVARSGAELAPQAAGPKAITVASTVLRPVLHSKLHGGVGSYARWYW